MATRDNEILCIGEILWDALPLGLFLGGAPFNVACHLHELGEEVTMISRVGDDVLGREALRRLRMRGMSTESVQLDPSLQTGFVEVSVDHEGMPEYVIVEPAAWDAIPYTDDLGRRAKSAQAVVFGTLAQRAPTSRETIQAVCAHAERSVLDVNLREPFVSRNIVEDSLSAADIVKLNDEELVRMQAWFGLPGKTDDALSVLAADFSCEVICLTRGKSGAMLFRNGELTAHSGYVVEANDTVGAGDAFLSALLLGLLQGADSVELLARANYLGAYVATQLGGTPSYDIASPSEVHKLPLGQQGGTGQPQGGTGQPKGHPAAPQSGERQDDPEEPQEGGGQDGPEEPQDGSLEPRFDPTNLN